MYYIDLQSTVFQGETQYHHPNNKPIGSVCKNLKIVSNLVDCECRTQCGILHYEVSHIANPFECAFVSE